MLCSLLKWRRLFYTKLKHALNKLGVFVPILPCIHRKHTLLCSLNAFDNVLYICSYGFLLAIYLHLIFEHLNSWNWIFLFFPIILMLFWTLNQQYCFYTTTQWTKLNDNLVEWHFQNDICTLLLYVIAIPCVCWQAKFVYLIHLTVYMRIDSWEAKSQKCMRYSSLSYLMKFAPLFSIYSFRCLPFTLLESFFA